MKEIKITIDTNLLVYLFDINTDEDSVLKSCRLIKAIFDCSKFVKLDTKISTSFEDDISEDRDELRKKSVSMRVQNIFQQVSIGRTVLKNKEHLPKNTEDRKDFVELKRILFSGLSPISKSYVNSINDVMHILSHIKNGRNIYITNDKNFLNKRELIQNAFHTQIMSADEFINYIYSFKDIESYEYKTAPKRLDYVNTKLNGKGELDFTNNNGIYTIGNGEFIFEINWGECNHEFMRIYNHPTTIESIALAEDKKLKEVINDRYYDFTDHCREMRRKKDIMILKNSKGYYAAIKLIDFEVKSRGGKRNYLTFDYVINVSGECNFKSYSF